MVVLSLILAADGSKFRAMAAEEASPSLAFSRVPEAVDWRSLSWHYAPVAASALLAGSGQMLQGEWQKGWGHLLLSGIFYEAAQDGTNRSDNLLRFVGAAGLCAIGAYSVYDAFRGVDASQDGATAQAVQARGTRTR